MLRHILEEIVCPGIILAKRRSADLQVREALVQMIRRGLIELEEISVRTVPGRRHVLLPASVLEAQVRLIPDLPVLDIILEAVCPSFGVVTDDMLAYPGPFLIVLRRNHAIFLAPFLDGLSQTVEHLGSGCLDVGQKHVGQFKVI